MKMKLGFDAVAFFAFFRTQLQQSSVKTAITDTVNAFEASLEKEFKKNTLGCAILRSVHKAANASEQYITSQPDTETATDFEITILPEDTGKTIREFWRKSEIGDGVIAEAEAELQDIFDSFPEDTMGHWFCKLVLAPYFSNTLKDFKNTSASKDIE